MDTAPEGNWTFPAPDALTAGTAKDLSASHSAISGFCFGNDGAKAFIWNHAVDTVYGYDLSGAYDMTTAVLDGNTDDDAANVLAEACQINADGTYIYYLDNFDDIVTGLPMSTPYDLSTATGSDDQFDTNTETSSAVTFCFGNAGLKMYVGTASQTTDGIWEYDLDPAYDVSTAVVVQQLDLNALAQKISAIVFQLDGLGAYWIDADSPYLIRRITLGTAWDLSSATLDSETKTVAQEVEAMDIDVTDTLWVALTDRTIVPYS